MDINELPPLVRLLEDEVEDASILDNLNDEIEDAQEENRKLQLTIITPSSTTQTPAQALEAL